MFTEEEIKELEPAPKPTIDLWLFIEAAKQSKGYKIGIISQDVKEGFTRFVKGQFVLYRPYTANEMYGNALWKDIKQYCTLCTTCMPYLDSVGKLVIASCCVGVPLHLISHEIKFENP